MENLEQSPGHMGTWHRTTLPCKSVGEMMDF